MRNRIVSDEERNLFERHVEAGRLIRTSKPKPGTHSKLLAFENQKGVNRATEQRLARGKLEPQLRIDLHGMNQARAHRTLLSSLIGAHQKGVRLVLVITGKGNPPKEQEISATERAHGVLKEMVPRWLGQSRFAGLISAVRCAHLRHGGQGALYVYLRKSR